MLPPASRFSAAACVVWLTVAALGQDEPGQNKGSKPANPKMDGKTDMAPPGGKSAPPDKKGMQKFAEEVRPQRDPRPVAGAIDRWVDAALATAHVPASAQADDAEFLRRVTLDLVGRVPTLEEATTFLASADPEKRAQWVDALLTSPSYGEHFATIWRELMLPRDNGVKGGRDEFAPWLAEQFSRNRGWDRIVTEMLTAEGKLRETPQAGFIMANSENLEPQPNLLADATGRLFWGVQLRCAECHDHPFANWKQDDFWGTAAFFSRLRKGYSEGKNPSGWTLTEAAPGDEVNQQSTKTWAAPGVTGPAILPIPGAGKAAGQVVRARFLGGKESGWTDDGPFRARFAEWAASARNPWFVANGVNRLWAHFFTRGLVMPMDGFNAGYQPSHPELLAALGKEFADSGFDQKHLIRCICNSRAYQRSSRPVAGNERDDKWLSHRLVKVMRPEVLYDSLSVALQPAGRKGGAKSLTVDRAQPLRGYPRDEFVRFFGSRPDENEGSFVNQGIPQLLRLMNGPLLNAVDAVGARLAKAGGGADETVDALYLAAYARKPTDEERRVVKETLIAPTGGADPSAGLLWALLNSSEFVTNH